MSVNETTMQAGGIPDLEIVRIFMRDIDVVGSVRKTESIEDYLDLLELFYADGEKKTALLPDLLDARNWDRYAIEVHGLKSAAANIGADKLSGLAKQHEDAAKSGNSEWILSNTDALADSYQLALAEIRRVLQQQEFGHFAKKDTSNLPSLAETELTARLQQAVQALEDFESKEAAGIVEELLGYQLPDDLRSALEKAQGHLKVYEDDEAEELLRGLL